MTKGKRKGMPYHGSIHGGKGKYCWWRWMVMVVNTAPSRCPPPWGWGWGGGQREGALGWVSNHSSYDRTNLSLQFYELI